MFKLEFDHCLFFLYILKDEVKIKIFSLQAYVYIFSSSHFLNGGESFVCINICSRNILLYTPSTYREEPLPVKPGDQNSCYEHKR